MDTMRKSSKSSSYWSVHKLLSIAGVAMLIASSANAESIQADIWADNWFTMFIGDTLVKEDSVSINTERSFNAESFRFETQLPAVLSFIIKDFKQNDTGLEYIGTRKQQMGDGGFIAQFTETATGATLLVSNDQWRCLPIHIAPLNKSCEKSSNPASDCKSSVTSAPANWQTTDFNDSDWPGAVQYSIQTVRPKDGYDRIDWHEDAKLIWTSDLETDNTLLCRVNLTSSKDL